MRRWIKLKGSDGAGMLDYAFTKRGLDQIIYSAALYLVAAAALYPGERDELPLILRPFYDGSRSHTIRVLDSYGEAVEAPSSEQLYNQLHHEDRSYTAFIAWQGRRSAYMAATSLRSHAASLRKMLEDSVRKERVIAMLAFCAGTKKKHDNVVYRFMSQDLLKIVFAWLKVTWVLEFEKVLPC